QYVDYLLDSAEGRRIARPRLRVLARARTGAPDPADAAAAVAVESAPVEKLLVPAAMVLALLGGNLRYPVRRGCPPVRPREPGGSGGGSRVGVVDIEEHVAIARRLRRRHAHPPQRFPQAMGGRPRHLRHRPSTLGLAWFGRDDVEGGSAPSPVERIEPAQDVRRAMGPARRADLVEGI